MKDTFFDDFPRQKDWISPIFLIFVYNVFKSTFHMWSCFCIYRILFLTVWRYMRFWQLSNLAGSIAAFSFDRIDSLDYL